MLLLLFLLALVWFLPLGIRHLVPNDEGRYAEMAREMFVTGDWITPRYNGYKYFEKPPLETWANALTFVVFGIGDWQARLYTALTGFAGIVLVGFTTARLFDCLTGVYAGIILASCPYWNLMGHYNTLDMGLAFWMEATLCALLLAQRPALSATRRTKWMCASWAAMALAVLSKGLVGLILPGTVLILYSLVARDWRLWTQLRLRYGVPLFAVIVAPWFILVQEKNPEFFHFFFIVQQFQRYLTPDQHRPGPLYYFVPILLIGFLPWLSLCKQAMRAGRAMNASRAGAVGHPEDHQTKHSMRNSTAEGAQKRFAPVTLLLVWSVFIFVFFSISHSKLLSYVLPVAPACAILLALGARQISASRWRKHLLTYGLLLLIGFGGAIYLGKLGSANTPNALYRAFQVWVFFALTVATALTAVAFLLLRAAPEKKLRAILCFATAWFSLCTIAGNGHEVMGRESAGVALVPKVKAAMALLPPDTPFYSITKLDHTMPYYLGHTMIMVQGADELQFGVDAEPQKWIPTIAQWVQRWNTEPAGLALMGPDCYDALRAMHVPMTVIARDTRRVIVEKPVQGLSHSDGQGN